MNDITLGEMWHMPGGDVAKLKPHQLLSLIEQVDEQMRKARMAKDWLNGALARKYEDKAKAARRKLGKDTGIVRLEDEGVTVICELPKKVEWDQHEMASIVLQLMADGKKVDDYVEHQYRVSERKYNAWPSDIRALFEKARTIKTGKPTFKLVISDAGGDQ